MSGRLILLCGLAGAGKTTLAKEFEADGAVRMCPDEWLDALGFDIYDRDARIAVEALQWEFTQTLVVRGMTVVDECGVWQRRERDLRRTWARERGIPVELRFLDAPIDVLTARVAERTSSPPSSRSGAIASSGRTPTSSRSSIHPRVADEGDAYTVPSGPSALMGRYGRPYGGGRRHMHR
jgi:predicted kinase